MAPKLRSTGLMGSAEKLSLTAACGILTLYLATVLRQGSFVASPETFGYLQVACGLMALTVAGASFLRFYGDQDRFALFLGFAFLVSGVVIFSTLGSLVFAAQAVDPSSMGKIPIEWVLSQSIFALLLVAALVFERRARFSDHPGREIALAVLLSIGFAFLLSVVYSGLSTSWHVRTGAAISRPWNLIEIAVLLIPTIGFGRRCKGKGSPRDTGIFIAAVLTVAGHIAASQSEHLLDAPFMVAEGLKTLGYTAALGGVLVENARSFKEVQFLSARDSLTGLANYRSLITVIESELQRSSRNGRQFAVLLVDLDGLKTINDRYGHLVGSRALCRVADILRVVCRGTDTSARYGGDEFAMVLPESDGESSSSHVIARIHAQLAMDPEFPPLSVSIGRAVCPADGLTPATLLAAADKSLYEMKHTHNLRLVSNRA